MIWPNPMRPDKGDLLKFGNIPDGTAVRVYDINGELVYSTITPIPKGWDARNNNGRTVATGVYHLVLALPANPVAHFRLAVIRDPH